VDLTIRNETGAWSAMAAAGKPALLTSGDGTTTACATVKVGTGGHRLGPGMQMRGYQPGPKSTPTTELIRVECAGATAGPGSRLALDYGYVTGEYNYYDPDATRTDAKLEVPLDPIATDLGYPIGRRLTARQPADLEMAASTTSADRQPRSAPLPASRARQRATRAVPSSVHIDATGDRPRAPTSPPCP
jgi:hypothetical protein